MSDRVAVFNAGRIEQVGAPAEVYRRPASEFIAGFVGVSNMLERAGRRFTVRPEKIHLLGEEEVSAAGATVEEGRIADVVYVGAITLPRRARRRRRADGSEPEPRARLERGAGRTGTACPGEWLPEHAFHIETGSNGGDDR